MKGGVWWLTFYHRSPSFGNSCMHSKFQNRSTFPSGRKVMTAEDWWEQWPLKFSAHTFPKPTLVPIMWSYIPEIVENNLSQDYHQFLRASWFPMCLLILAFVWKTLSHTSLKSICTVNNICIYKSLCACVIKLWWHISPRYDCPWRY